MTAQTILPANTLSSGYDVGNSVRFNRADSAILNKTFDDDGTHHDKGTISLWIKRNELGAEEVLFSAGASNREFIRFESNDTLTYRSVAESYHLNTNRVFRDISAWYHIVVAFDSSQGTASNRNKIYVNGVQETSFATETYTPNQNMDHKLLSGELNSLGKDSEQNTFAACYFCEVVGIDGVAHDPTSFGEFDEDSGIWKPKSVSGLTFGTNGFHLNFADSSALGTDVSGNGNNFANTNLAAVDQTTDTCTNNFATMNSLDNFYAGSTFSEGNCRVVTGSSPQTWNTSTFGLSAGKWYMEATIIDGGSGGSTLIGIADRPTVSADEELGGLATTYAYLSSGNFRTGDSNTSNSVSATDGDIIGVALDLDSGQNTISYYKNNTLIVAAQNITAPVSGNYFIASGVWLDNDTGTTDHNFGNPVVAHSSAASDANGYGSFEYAPPSGYYAICTKNLAEYG